MAVTASNPLSKYTQAQINAAAQKIISTNPTYKNYNVSGLVAAAQSKPSLMTALTGELKTATAAPAAAAPAAISLPDPKTATNSVTVSGKTYYVLPASGTRAATWVVKNPSGSLTSVDTKGQPTSVASFINQAEYAATVDRIQSASAKPAAPAPAPAPKPVVTTPAPAPAAPAVVTPPASLKLPDAATAMQQILNRDPAAPPTMKTDSTTGTAYYLVPPSAGKPAQWVSVNKGATTASNGQAVSAINTAQTSYIQANAKPLPAPTPAPTPAAPVAPTPVAPAITATQQAYYDKVAAAIKGFTPPTDRTYDFSGTGTGTITYVPADPIAKTSAGFYIESGGGMRQVDANGVPTGDVLTYDAFNRLKTTAATNASQATAAEKQRLQQLESTFVPQLGKVNTQAEFDKVVADAKAAGYTIPSASVEASQTALNSRLQAAESARIQKLTNDFNTQVREVTTQADLDRIKADAQAQGITLSPDVVKMGQGLVDRTVKQQQEIATTIGGTGLGDLGRSIYTPSGIEIATLPDDPTTGAKGGYYLYNGQGFQQLDATGQVTGAVIPRDEFNTLQQSRVSGVQEFQRYQARLADEAKMAEQVKNFEAALPQPGSDKFNYLLANRFMLDGPDGRVYELVAKNEKTGEPAGWLVSTAPGVSYTDTNAQYTRLDQPDTVVSKGDINQVFTQNAEIINARLQAERAAQAARDKESRNVNFGDTMRFALGAIGLIYGASLLAELGAAAASAASETAAAMAGTGSTAAEIGSTLEALYGVSPEIASGMAGEAAASVSMSEAAFAAADAAQLAAQGLSQAAIEQNLVFAGLDAAAAADAAALAASGISEAGIADVLTETLANTNLYGSGPVIPETPGVDVFAEAPTTPTTPVSTTPPTETGAFDMAGVGEAAGPVQPQTPIDVTSTGISDAAPGTVFEGPNGPEVVLDSGKTVNLGEYTEAVTSGQPVSIDGNLPTRTINIDITTGPQIPTDVTDVVGAVTDTVGGGIPTLPEVVVTAPPYGIEDILADIALPGAVIGGAAVLGGGGGGAPATAPVSPPTPPAETPIEPRPTEPTEPAAPVEPTAPTEPTPPTTPTEGTAPTTPTEPAAPVEPTAPTTPTEPTAPTTPTEGTAPTTPTEPTPPTTPTTGGSTGTGTVQEIPPGSTTPSGPVQPLPDTTVTPVDVTTPPVTPEVPVVPPVVPPTTTPPPTTPPVEPVPTEPPPTEPPPTETTPPGEQPPAEIIDRSVPYDPTQPPGDLWKAISDIYGEIPWWAKLAGSLYGLGTAPTLDVPTYGPIGPTQWGTVGRVNQPGVNPGFFTAPTPYYQTTSPVQARYYYGQRPLQTGTEFSQAQYNAAPGAPAQPWGLQQMYTPTDINAYLAELNQPAGPVSPT